MLATFRLQIMARYLAFRHALSAAAALLKRFRYFDCFSIHTFCRRRFSIAAFHYFPAADFLSPRFTSLPPIPFLSLALLMPDALISPFTLEAL